MLPFGVGNIAYFWEQKRAYRKIVRLISWSDNDYDQYNVKKSDLVDGRVIWMYWKQGLENAPTIVKKCISSVKANKGDKQLIILNEKNVSDYVNFPDFIEEKHKKGIIGEAHYSDLLRIQLLIQYGGIWIDATCYMSDSFPEVIEKTPFFMFSAGEWWPDLYTVSKCSNWFIKAERNNDLLKKTRNFLFEHWRVNNRAVHYFVFHFAFTALVNTNKDCASIWRNVPFISNLNPHLLLFSFSKPFQNVEYENILSQCFVHKCTYKFDLGLLNAEQENMLQHFLNN